MKKTSTSSISSTPRPLTEILKIMPTTAALALVLTLSGCKETGEKTPIPM